MSLECSAESGRETLLCSRLQPGVCKPSGGDLSVNLPPRNETRSRREQLRTSLLDYSEDIIVCVLLTLLTLNSFF